LKTFVSDKTRREALRVFDMMPSDRIIEALSMLPSEMLPKYQAQQFTDSFAKDEADSKSMFSPRQAAPMRHDNLVPRSHMELNMLNALANPAPKGGRIGAEGVSRSAKGFAALRSSENPALHIVQPKMPKIDSRPEMLEALAAGNNANPSNTDSGGAGRESR
jgi:hypothetical protein